MGTILERAADTIDILDGMAEQREGDAIGSPLPREVAEMLLEEAHLYRDIAHVIDDLILEVNALSIMNDIYAH